MTLFSNGEVIEIEVIDSHILYFPGFLSPEEADTYYQHFYTNTEWRQDPIRVFGKVYAQPRLTALYADNSKSYTYSGITMNPLKFDKPLEVLKRKIEAVSRTTFSTCLLNLYRDGSDSNGWHADDEKELGINPVIASISLGQNRYFHLRHKQRKELKHKLLLEHGSLLLMQGETQHHWQHQIPKTKKPVNPRINLTFRYIK